MTYYIFFLYNKSIYFGAEDEVRTRDILLGRQVLYQLSYFRLAESEGFEPSVRFTTYDRLATCCFRPLSQLS